MAPHAHSLVSLLQSRDVPAPVLAPCSDSHSHSDDELTDVAVAVNAALNERGLARSLAIGRALVRHVYDGDINGFRARERKSVPLRRLSDLVPASAAALYRCLSVHEIWVRTSGCRWPSLHASHYRAVESLVPDTQAGWLARAAEQKWSAARLREAVLAAGVRVARRGGRLPEHPVARLVARLDRELSLMDSIATALEVHPQQRKEMATLADRLDEAGERCEGHAARLRSSIARHR